MKDKIIWDKQLIESIFNNAIEGMLVTDSKGKILEVNPSFYKITGYTHEEVIGKNPNILKSGKQSKAFYEKMWMSIQDVGEWKGEIWNKRKNGDIYLEYLTVTAIKSKDGNIVNYLGLMSDITYLKEFKNNMQRQLDLARNIQKNLLPLNPPQLKDIEIVSLYKPMEEVGGDFFDFFQTKNPDMLGVFISDISGHGVPAAFITSMVKIILENSDSAKFFPNFLLKYLNQKMMGQINGHFLTAFYAVYYNPTKKLTYARAGHPYPILIRNNEILELESKGQVIGIWDELKTEEKEIFLEKGDKILFYTDGLVEAINHKNIEFGDILSNILKELSHNPIKLLVNKLYGELESHHQKKEFDDDVCIIGIEIL